MLDITAASRIQLEERDRHAVSIGWLLATVDFVVILGSFGIALWLVGGLSWEAAWSKIHVHYSDTPIAIYLALGIACLLAFRYFGHYARRRPFWEELGDIIAIVSMMAAAHAALIFMTKADFSRLWWGMCWTLVLLMVPLARFMLKRLLMARGLWWRPTVVIGAGPNAIDTARALAGEPLLGFDVVAFVCPPMCNEQAPAHLEINGRRLPVLLAVPYPKLLPTHLGQPHVVVALELEEMGRCGEYLERLSLRYGDIDIISPIRGLRLTGTRVTHFFSHDILSLRVPSTLARPWPPRLKRGFDIVVGGPLLALASPLLAIIAWQIWRTGRPVFYRHKRVGRGGRSFHCLKFRTMVPDADAVLAHHVAENPEAGAEWTRDQKLRHDPRITPLGAWLRRTSLDELPQLINVLRGEMSLVGPRPVVPSELALYDENLVYYMESTPGLTGLWQVSGRNDLDYRPRIHLDCWYIRNWSLWGDLIILMKTPRAVLRGKGAY